MVPLAAGTSWPGRWTCRWPGAGSNRGSRVDGAGGSGGEPRAPSLQRSPLPVASGMVPPRVDRGLSEAFPDSPCVPITPSTPGAAVRCPGRQLTLPNPCPPACVPCPCSLHLFAMPNSLLHFTLRFSKTGLLTAAAVNPSGPRGDPAPRAVLLSVVPGSPSAGHRGGLHQPLLLCWELVLLQQGAEMGPGSIPISPELPAVPRPPGQMVAGPHVPTPAARVVILPGPSLSTWVQPRSRWPAPAGPFPSTPSPAPSPPGAPTRCRQHQSELLFSIF